MAEIGGKSASGALRPNEQAGHRDGGRPPVNARHLPAVDFSPDAFETHVRRRGLRAAARGAPRGRIPKAATPRQRMQRKLLTTRGQALYRRRGQTVEPVFGQIKDPRGIRGFMRRGLAACQSEWKLITAAHNLLKLWRSGRSRPSGGSKPALAPA